MKIYDKKLAYPYFVWMVLFTVVPLFIVVYYAMTDAEGNFTLNNLTSISGYGSVFARSLLLALIATVICLIIAFPVGYFLSRLRVNKQHIMLMLVMLPMWMNFLLRTYAWMGLLSVNGPVNTLLATLCNEVAESGSASAAQICETSAFAIIQLSPLFILLPFIILTLTDKHNLIKNLIIALWVGVISVIVQFVCGYYLGSETPAIIGSLAAIIAIIAYAKVFARKSKVQDKETFTLAESLKAWSVYLFILIFILVSGALCPPVNAFLKSHLVSAVHLPVLDSTFKFGWISNAGLMLFLGATIGGLVQGLSLKRLMVILARTTVNLRKTVVTICSLIALASVMNYSGMITSIASGLVAVTGDFYPLVAPMIGAIGTFVTGSDTSSNILFAKLQAHVANQLGMTGQSTFFGMEGGQENWLVAANTTGATGGKMISPQSIAIATAACDMEGKDGEILRSAIPYALLYIVLGGLMVYFGC